jgi:hypothetical protein
LNQRDHRRYERSSEDGLLARTHERRTSSSWATRRRRAERAWLATTSGLHSRWQGQRDAARRYGWSDCPSGVGQSVGADAGVAG